MRIAPLTLQQEAVLLSSRIKLMDSLLADELVTRGHIADLS
jgi:hypothetical protein